MSERDFKTMRDSVAELIWGSRHFYIPLPSCKESCEVREVWCLPACRCRFCWGASNADGQVDPACVPRWYTRVVRAMGGGPVSPTDCFDFVDRRRCVLAGRQGWSGFVSRECGVCFGGAVGASSSWVEAEAEVARSPELMHTII